MDILFPLIKGFGASACLIIVIGPQNAFVLKQGLRRHHVLLVALVCSLIDSVLIISGVLGLGHFISSSPTFIEFMKYFASVFLFVYGIISFKAAFSTKKNNHSLSDVPLPKIKKTVLLLLTLSLLNPHVYLDTVIILGSIAAEYPVEEKLYFCLGAIAASFAWFFAISYGARLLDPFFKNPNSWRVIDCLTGLIMWGIAFSLIY